MRRGRLVLALSAVGLVPIGCANAKYEDDVRMLCNAEAEWEAAEKPGAMMDPGIRRRKMFAWAEDRAKTSDGKRTVQRVAALSGESEKAKALREEAKKANVSPCPLADAFEKEAGTKPR